MTYKRNDFVLFLYEGQKKYGRIRVVRQTLDGVKVSMFVFSEWKWYKNISPESIIEVIPTIHNLNELSKLDLRIGSKLYLGSYISANDTWSRRNTVDYPLRWTVKKKFSNELIILCDWIVETCPLTEFNFYVESISLEAFSVAERSVIMSCDSNGSLKSCLCLPEMEDVCDENGNPEIMAAPFLWTLFESKIEYNIEEQFPYWVASQKPDINIVAPWGWDKAEDDADAIGYRPKAVLKF